MLTDSLKEKVTFESSLERGDGEMQKYEKSMPGIADGKCKGLETQACMRNGKGWEAWVLMVPYGSTSQLSNRSKHFANFDVHVNDLGCSC